MSGLSLALLWPALSSAQAVASDVAEPAEAAPQPDSTKLACAKAYEMTQRFRQDGKLLQARESALTCAQSACPGVLNGDCSAWLSELDAAIASVIIEVRDSRGQSLTPTQVTVDESSLVVDGRAVPVDPGLRRFVVVLPDGKRLEKTAVVNEGQKAQVVRFELPAAPQPEAAPASQGRSLLPLYGAAALVVGGGVGFAYFGLQGRADERELRARCAPRCSDSELEPLGRMYLAADVSAGIGVVGLGLLGYFLLTNDGEPTPTSGVGAQVSSQSARLSYRASF